MSDVITHQPLRLSTAIITASSGYRFETVQVVIEDGVATVRERDGRINGTKDGVLAVTTPPDSRGWLVTFDTGETWTVERDRGCGCAGSR
jgi:hypothetical protein